MKYTYIGKSYSGNEYRVIDMGEHGFIERNQAHCPDDWFLITLLPIDEAIKKAQDFVKRSYTGMHVACPYNF